MLDPKMEKQLNQQINEELFSSYLYLAMSAYFSAEGLKGIAHWLHAQSQEEKVHAMKIYDYINDHGGRVLLQAISEPQASYGSYTEIFKEVLAHEQKITQQISGLVDLANKLGDHATHVFLQWFVTEQVEEEGSAQEVLQKVELVGDNGPGLLALDREMGARTP